MRSSPSSTPKEGSSAVVALVPLRCIPSTASAIRRDGWAARVREAATLFSLASEVIANRQPPDVWGRGCRESLSPAPGAGRKEEEKGGPVGSCEPDDNLGKQNGTNSPLRLERILAFTVGPDPWRDAIHSPREMVLIVKPCSDYSSLVKAVLSVRSGRGGTRCPG